MKDSLLFLPVKFVKLLELGNTLEEFSALFTIPLTKLTKRQVYCKKLSKAKESKVNWRKLLKAGMTLDEYEKNTYKQRKIAGRHANEHVFVAEKL